ncbi:MAG: prolyl oligopeptidase family serine peptidase [Acidobacteriota bacterium]
MKIKSLLIIVSLMFSLTLVSAENVKKGDRIKITKWLKLGPAPVTKLERKIYKNNKDIANHRYLDISALIPEAGKRVTWKKGKTLRWTKVSEFSTRSSYDSIYYFATFLDAYSTLRSKLIVEGLEESLVDIFFDGRAPKKDYDNKKAKVKVSLDILNEKHILLLKVFVPANKSFRLNAFIDNGEQVKTGKLKISDSLYRRVNFRNILNMISVSNVKVSPNGRFAALSLKKTEQTGDSSSWSEIVKVSDGSVIFTTKGVGKLSGFSWLRDSESFSYSISRKGKTSLFRFNLKNKRRKIILRNVKDLSDHWWSPDNSFIIYTTYKKKKMGKGFRYIKNIPERARSGSYTYSMYLYYPEGSVTHKISTNNDNFSSVLISPDSKKAILGKSVADHKNRPYYKSIYYLIDLGSFDEKKLFESNFVSPALWSPDSKKILMTGGPSSFNSVGKNVKEGVIPNEYDTQVFIYNLLNGNIDPITKTFKPSVNSVHWSRNGKYIYIKAGDRSYVNLFKYSIAGRNFRKIKTPVDVIGRISFAKNTNIAVFQGSGSTLPHKLYKTNLNSGTTVLLKDYNRKDFKYVKFGKIENYNVKLGNGKTITGRLYYPGNFSSLKEYPCIVYYYGGTSPVERTFGGRYPFNWYAANGYIVYVLQPSGAVGFGQEFSAVHVNDWGKTTSAEVIEATKELLRTHKFIDPEKVGAMGASYGGFLTQYIATQTDIFSGFISHAGISALSSYWGVGDWGYTYSGVATAGSFPWNRKDIYVGHSPLFMADRINTPLLLLHGDIDNNVPPGESYQMFAALKLLGKEVALVTLDGQSHWIMKYEKRVFWMKTIMAWFDKWLKKDPAYWNTLYKDYMDIKQGKSN